MQARWRINNTTFHQTYGLILMLIHGYARLALQGATYTITSTAQAAAFPVGCTEIQGNVVVVCNSGTRGS